MTIETRQAKPRVFIFSHVERFLKREPHPTTFHEWKTILEHYGIASKLRDLSRRGWVIRMASLGKDEAFIAENAENVWDHSDDVAGVVLSNWRYSGLSDELQPKAMSMAILHDVAEVIAGDATPYDGQEKPDFTVWESPSTSDIIAKFLKERRALGIVINNLPPKEQIELIALWEEFNQQQTPLAQFVRDCDIFAAARKAQEYVKMEIFPETFNSAFNQQINEEMRNISMKNIILKGTPV